MSEEDRNSSAQAFEVVCGSWHAVALRGQDVRFSDWASSADIDVLETVVVGIDEACAATESAQSC